MCILADWGGADDEAIWEYARREGFTIVSKDSDFQERSVLCGSPPKVIWLRIPNSSTSEIAACDSWRSSRDSGFHRRSLRDAASFESPLACPGFLLSIPEILSSLWVGDSGESSLRESRFVIEGDSKVGAFRHGPVKILRQLPVRKGFRFQRGYSVARAIGGVGLIVGSSFVGAENLPVSASASKPSSAPFSSIRSSRQSFQRRSRGITFSVGTVSIRQGQAHWNLVILNGAGQPLIGILRDPLARRFAP